MSHLVSGSGTFCHPHSVRGNDYYKTPPEAVHALLENFDVPQIIHESSCGDGAIVDILRASGRTVYASDIVDRGCPNSYVADFLEQKEPIPGVECCLGNPPFKLAHEFVRKSRELYPMTIFLLRLAFLESVRRSDILDAGDLAKVLLFKKRLPFMHRDGWAGKRNSNSGMPFAWFIFNRHSSGPAVIERIDWKPLPKIALQAEAYTKTSPLTPLEKYIEASKLNARP